jgi:molybdopterin synthase catalytic subunit
MRSRGRITRMPIDLVEVVNSVRDDSAGGIVLFVGTVRNSSGGKKVGGLEYEVYKDMAEKMMFEIEEKARSKWHIKKIVTRHRWGDLKVGEVSVAVAVSSEHRGEAFEACRYAINAIKRTVPLWKKERAPSGQGIWVEGSPIKSLVK